jgi:hypothetical protein
MFNTQETHGNANQDTATQTPQTLAPTIALPIRNADTGHLDASLRVIGSMRRFLSNIWLWRSMSWVEHGGRLALRLRTRAYFTANLQVFCR